MPETQMGIVKIRKTLAEFPQKQKEGGAREEELPKQTEGIEQVGNGLRSRVFSD